MDGIMASNLRAKPISGHVTDGAGNVIRNSQITIRSFTPTGDFVVDSVVTNDDGFFVSAPLPNGEYAIYDSGVMISTTIHVPDADSVPVYSSNPDNVGSAPSDFNTLMEDGTPNSFRVYLQLEAPSTNVVRYGSTYQIYDVDLKSSLVEGYKNLSDFHSLGQDSRITTTRFDIEYFVPITETSKQYRRIRWAGVPAIRYASDTRLVIPLDYYSIVPNMPKHVEGDSSPTGQTTITVDDVQDSTVVISGMDPSTTNTGDIIKLEYPNAGEQMYWYGINVGESGSTITLKQWLSSRVEDLQDDSISSGQDHVKAYVYDGMFPGLSVINASTNEYITVTENGYAQDLLEELYEYSELIEGV